MAEMGKKKRPRGMHQAYDPQAFARMQQEAMQDDQQRVQHDQEPTVWVYLPFKSGSQEDQRHMAQSFIDERTKENPRAGKKYRLVEHTGGEGGLKDVQPNDTVYIYAHGAERDTQNIYNLNEEPLSTKGLVNQMLGVEQMNPNGVKIKLGNCYSANVEHTTKAEAQTMDTYTSNFTKELSEASLKQGKGLPQYVDGYIGGVQNQNVIVSQDGLRHRGANMPDDDRLKKIQSLELMKLTTPDKVRDAAKLTEPFRASDNRWRYRPQQSGLHTVDVNLDETEFDRMSKVHEDRRLEAERLQREADARHLEELSRRMGEMEMQKQLNSPTPNQPTTKKNKANRGAIKF